MKAFYTLVMAEALYQMWRKDFGWRDHILTRMMFAQEASYHLQRILNKEAQNN